MITCELDQARARAFVTIEGELADAEAVGWFAGFVEELGGLRRVGGIVDTRPLGAFKVSSYGIQELTRTAEANDAIFAGSRWAIVAEQDVVFGMARMYQIMRKGAPYALRVFRSMDEAQRWMDAGDDPAP